MVLSPALNIRSARGPIYDADALAFCRASGATARKAISDFVKGVKALGLWNSMVCWPLRSSQNAGNGDTVHSLGGLGTFNGTRVNGPAWGADGLSFPETTPVPHVLTTLSPSLSENFRVFAAFQCNAEGSAINVVASSRAADPITGLTGGFSFGQSWNGNFRGIVWGSALTDAVGPAAITNGSYNTAVLRGDVATSTHVSGITVNDGAETTSTTSGVTKGGLAPMVLGAETPTQRALSGNLPFVAYLRVSSFDNAAFRSLYKSTLGTGLGLP